MIQIDMFTKPETGKRGSRKYDHVRPVAIDIRRNNPKLTSPMIRDVLAKMGVSPLPVAGSIAKWCMLAGLPFPEIGTKGKQFSDELRSRVLDLKNQGMTTPAIMDLLKAEGAKVPSKFWINELYRKSRAGAKHQDPFQAVAYMLHYGMIESGEIIDELTKRGISFDAAMDWAMQRFYGGDRNPIDSGGSDAKIFSIGELRWAA